MTPRWGNLSSRKSLPFTAWWVAWWVVCWLVVGVATPGWAYGQVHEGFFTSRPTLNFYNSANRNVYTNFSSRRPEWQAGVGASGYLPAITSSDAYSIGLDLSVEYGWSVETEDVATLVFPLSIGLRWGAGNRGRTNQRIGFGVGGGLSYYGRYVGEWVQDEVYVAPIGWVEITTRIAGTLIGVRITEYLGLGELERQEIRLSYFLLG